jgi:hypothetical protein
VIFDAPATGHAALMLTVPRTTASAVRSGPLHSNAVKIQHLLEDHAQTCVITVTLAEEMAVAEALELSSRVADEFHMATGPIVINRTTPQLFTAAEIAALQTLRGASPTLARMIATAAARCGRASAEAEHIAMLESQRDWLVEVPHVVLARHDADALLGGMSTALRALVQPHG